MKRFLEECATRPETPFFLHYNPGPPHMPLGPAHAPERYVRMYDPANVPLRPNVFDADGEPAHDERWFTIYTVWDYFIRHFRGAADQPTDHPPPGTTLRALTAWYLGMVSLVDELVGAVMEKLTAAGLEQNTVVVFTSDHGDNLGSHGKFNKGALIEESIRVPLIVRAPGRVQPAVHTAQVAQLIDLCPTLLALARLEAPPDLEGRDLTPVLEGREDRLEDEAAVIESSGQGVGIRTPTHMLGIPHASGGAPRALGEAPAQLYDLREDPYQLHNRSEDPEKADVRAELTERVRAWDRSTPWWQAG